MDSFSIKPTIYSGSHALDYLNTLNGNSALIVTDKMMVQFGFAEQVCGMLQAQNIRHRLYDSILPDPDISTIVQGMKFLDQNYPDIVIALGGGSVIDAAKAILYSLWCFNNQQQPSVNAKPLFIAIPTTSGTGSEVTAFSVIKANSEKLVLVDKWMLPDIAILDPRFVKSVPPKITADTGMDVLCHALEAYVSTKANDFSDGLAEKAVKLVFEYLLECYRNGSNELARGKMHNASCIAGMAFTNASLGITHSLAHALGGVFGIPHGRANALLLPYVVEFNADIHGSCDNLAAKKYAELAKMLGLPCKTQREAVLSLIAAIDVLKEELTIPININAQGVKDHDFYHQLDNLVYQALKDSCTPTNPRTVCERDLETIYLNAFIGK